MVRRSWPVVGALVLCACGGQVEQSSGPSNNTGGQPSNTAGAGGGAGAGGSSSAGTGGAPASATNDYIVNASIWGSPEGDVFIAGYRADGSAAQKGFVKKLQAEQWASVGETREDLWGIWGTSSTDFFVFGGQDAVLRHSEGQWHSWNLSSIWVGRTDSTIRGIWGTSPKDVFAVGRQGTIAHFDGTSWGPMPVPTGADLAAVWGTSTQSALAVGSAGTILRYDGIAWKLEASPTTATLQGIWGSSPTDVFVIGETVPEQSHVILHYDGSSWSVVHEGEMTLMGIHGSRPDCVYAVGGKREGGAVLSGLFSFDGSSWTQRADGTAMFLWGVWVTSDCGFYAVGPADTIIHRSR